MMVGHGGGEPCADPPAGLLDLLNAVSTHAMPTPFPAEGRVVVRHIPEWGKCVIYDATFWNACFCRNLPYHYLEIG